MYLGIIYQCISELIIMHKGSFLHYSSLRLDLLNIFNSLSLAVSEIRSALRELWVELLDEKYQELDLKCPLGGMLHTSTAPLPTMGYTTMGYTTMGYTTMGYTTMIDTSSALYFYKQFTQAPNKFFLKHFRQKICKLMFLTSFVKKVSL